MSSAPGTFPSLALPGRCLRPQLFEPVAQVATDGADDATIGFDVDRVRRAGSGDRSNHYVIVIRA
jgi:hypothetical protein